MNEALLVLLVALALIVSAAGILVPVLPGTLLALAALFVWALVSGHWEEAGALQNHAAAVGGLVVGGLIAAPFAGLIVKKVPRKALTYAVGFLLLILAAFQGAQLLKLIG